jgi:hypothetical protein
LAAVFSARELYFPLPITNATRFSTPCACALGVPGPNKAKGATAALKKRKLRNDFIFLIHTTDARLKELIIN